jgi:hypothetical protein
MYRAVEGFLREKSKIGCPWLLKMESINFVRKAKRRFCV